MYLLDSLVTTDRTHRGAEAHRAWTHWCCTVHGEFDIDYPGDSYRGTVALQRTEMYQIVGWRSDSELVKRTPRGISRDPRGHYELFVPLEGRLFVGQDDADQPLRPGEMALVPINAPFHLGQQNDASALALLIPESLIDQRLDRTSCQGLRIVGDKGLARVTRDLLRSLVREREHLCETSFNAACNRAVDLFCLAAQGDEQAPTGDAAVLHAVRSQIIRHATDPDLRIGRIAAEIGWSTRHVQAVLSRHGTTATELIRTERLEIARVRLTDPTMSHKAISAIALSVGFTSASAFSTAFRRHFGQTPSDLRQCAEREGHTRS